MVLATSPLRYVVGFPIDLRSGRVLLLTKDSPDWQKGKLNGIGGKIEPTETPLQAMVREFKEETASHVTPEAWWCFHYEKFLNGVEIYFFVTLMREHRMEIIESLTKDFAEPCSHHLVTSVQTSITTPATLLNLPYLVSMAEFTLGESPLHRPIIKPHAPE